MYSVTDITRNGTDHCEINSKRKNCILQSFCIFFTLVVFSNKIHFNCFRNKCWNKKLEFNIYILQEQHTLKSINWSADFLQNYV